jgi:hypothetical protein
MFSALHVQRYIDGPTNGGKKAFFSTRRESHRSSNHLRSASIANSAGAFLTQRWTTASESGNRNEHHQILQYATSNLSATMPAGFLASQQVDSSNRRLWTVVDPDGVSLRPFKSDNSTQKAHQNSVVLPMGSVFVAEESSVRVELLDSPDTYRKHSELILSVSHPFRGWLPLDGGGRLVNSAVRSGSSSSSSSGSRGSWSVRPLRVEPDRRCDSTNFMLFTDFKGGM